MHNLREINMNNIKFKDQSLLGCSACVVSMEKTDISEVHTAPSSGRWYTLMRQHGATSQKAIIFILAAMRT
jgi:hypothetical protein